MHKDGTTIESSALQVVTCVPVTAMCIVPSVEEQLRPKALASKNPATLRDRCQSGHGIGPLSQ
jgi:hypothetical protein